VPKVSQYIFQSRHQVVYGLCRGKVQYVCHEIQTCYIKPCLATSVNSNSSLAALHSTRGIFEEKRTCSKMSRVVNTTTTVKTEHSNCDWGCHNSNDIQYIVTPMTYRDIFFLHHNIKPILGTLPCFTNQKPLKVCVKNFCYFAIFKQQHINCPYHLHLVRLLIP